jgi:hypothetical protein
MDRPDEPFESFTTGEWSQDYRELDEDAVESRLREDWRRELLLQDYEQASADARHRNRLVHYSFYIGMVIVGLLLNVGWQMWSRGAVLPLAGLLSVGGALHYLLYGWSVSARNSRDASWDRRSEIEDMVRVVDGDLLRSNDGVFKRLTRVADGRYALPGKDGIETGSIGTYIVRFNAVVAVLSALLAVLLFTVYVIRFAG